MVLVTGATGLLGRVIALELLKKGYDVRATKRPTSNLEDVKESYRYYTDQPDVFFDKIKWIDVDFEDLDSIASALQGVDEVYHCAAQVSFNPNKGKELLKTNVSGTENLLYCCDPDQIKKFLFVSSIAVLDLLNEKGELDESSDFNEKIDHSWYAISKHMSEMEVWRASAEGLNTIIVNPGIIIGSGNWEASSGKLFSTFEKTAFSFSGSTSYVDVRDVAKFSVDLMQQNTFGERFVLVAGQKRFADFSQIVRAKLNLSNTKIVSNQLVNGIGFLRYFGFLVPPLKMLSKTNIEAVTSDTKISSEKVKTRLNTSFIPVDESIQFHLNNYINYKNNKK